MKIYTSYYGRLRDLKENCPNVLPVAISGKAIDGFDKSLHFNRLAPTWDIWKEWHDSTNPYKDYRYQLRFFNEVLSKVDKQALLLEFQETLDAYSKAEGKNYDSIVMLCYEIPSKFCHRHIVAEWLKLDYPDIVLGEI